MDILSLIGLFALAGFAFWLLGKAVVKVENLITTQQELKAQVTLLTLERDNTKAKFDALNAFSDELVAKNKKLADGLRSITEEGLGLDDEDDAGRPEETWTAKEWDYYLRRLNRRIRNQAENTLLDAHKIKGDKGATVRYLMDSLLGDEPSRSERVAASESE